MTSLQVDAGRRMAAKPRRHLALVVHNVNVSRLTPSNASTSSIHNRAGKLAASKNEAAWSATSTTGVADQLCTCNSGRPYHECCFRLHSKLESPATPESLLRARFTALASSNVDFLADTCHPESLRSIGTRQARLSYYRRLISKARYVHLDDVSVVLSTDGQEAQVHYTLTTQSQFSPECVRVPYQDTYILDTTGWLMYSSKALRTAPAADSTAASGGFYLRGVPNFMTRPVELKYVDSWNGDGRYIDDDADDNSQE